MDYASKIYKAQEWWRNPNRYMRPDLGSMVIGGGQEDYDEFLDPQIAYQRLRWYWNMRPQDMERLPKDQYGNVLWQKTHKWTDEQVNKMARAVLALKEQRPELQYIDRQLTDENVFSWVRALTGKPAYGTQLAGQEQATVVNPTINNMSGIAAKVIAPPQRQINPWEAGRLGVMSNKLRGY